MAILIPCVLLILASFAYAQEIPQTERSEAITPFSDSETANQH
jgi:hypothetical protein